MKKIGLVGFFGWGNFGDELFVKTHREMLGDDFELEVVNDLTKAPYFSRPLDELVKDYDAFLIGGGDLLNPLRVSELYWNVEFLEKPVFVYGLGVPNQKNSNPKVLQHYRDFMQHPNCKMVVPRDVESYNWIVKNIQPAGRCEWFPDPVCAMSRPAPQPPTEKTLGVVMREHRSLDPDMGPVRDMIDTAKGMGYKIRHLVLANMDLGPGDHERAKLIAEDDEEVFVSDDLDEMCVAISQCSLLATIKFHGMIVATMYGIPSIAMSTTPKNRNFLKMIDRPEMLCSYREPTLKTRLSHYPARIHTLVRGNLYRRSREGYAALKEELHAALD